MNKSQLIESVVAKTGLKKKDVEVSINALVDEIAATLMSGEKVQISGLGTFEVKCRTARTGRNPKTQQVISIPSTKYPAYSASKTLKAAINK